MAKRERTRRAIQDEVSRRIQKIDEVAEEGVKVIVPAPEPHPRDARGRNWDIRRFGHARGYERWIRPVVDKLRDEFDLVDTQTAAPVPADPFAAPGEPDVPKQNKPRDPFGPA